MTFKAYLNAPMKDLKLLLQKLIYQVWNKYCDEEETVGKDYYYLKSLELVVTEDEVDLIKLRQIATEKIQ